MVSCWARGAGPAGEDSGVLVVGGLGADQRQRGVREHRVIPVVRERGEQIALLSALLVGLRAAGRGRGQLSYSPWLA